MQKRRSHAQYDPQGTGTMGRGMTGTNPKGNTGWDQTVSICPERGHRWVV